MHSIFKIYVVLRLTSQSCFLFTLVCASASDLFTLRHPYLQACKQGWVRSTLPSPPHFFRNSVMKNLLIYIVNFQIFRTSRPAVKEECFAPQTEEYKYEVGKIKNYSNFFNFPSDFNDIRRNQNYIMQQNSEVVFKNSEASKYIQI